MNAAITRRFIKSEKYSRLFALSYTLRLFVNAAVLLLVYLAATALEADLTVTLIAAATGIAALSIVFAFIESNKLKK